MYSMSQQNSRFKSLKLLKSKKTNLLEFETADYRKPEWSQIYLILISLPTTAQNGAYQ